jgi:hypothetical protein
VGKCPATHALAIEAELGGELVQTTADAFRRIRVEGRFVPPVAQKRGGVELALGEDRFRVDREPRLAACAQEVAAVEILVGDDELGLGRPGKLTFRTACAPSANVAVTTSEICAEIGSESSSDHWSAQSATILGRRSSHSLPPGTARHQPRLAGIRIRTQKEEGPPLGGSVRRALQLLTAAIRGQVRTRTAVRIAQCR